MMIKDKLLSPSFCYILAANFLLFFAFYLLLPVLPFYLKEQFLAGKSMIGFILSCYTVACLCIRPFSGYMLDTFSRKPLYLLSYFIFTVIFGGYMLAGALALFITLRIVHGFAFGMVSVAGNTIVIDILPSSRRGEGLGYYGLANNIAMSFGPMTGLFMHGACSYEVIFTCSLVSGCLGLIMASLVKTPYKQPVKREPISLDRFFLVKGLPAGVSLLLLSSQQPDHLSCFQPVDLHLLKLSVHLSQPLLQIYLPHQGYFQPGLMPAVSGIRRHLHHFWCRLLLFSSCPVLQIQLLLLQLYRYLHQTC